MSLHWICGSDIRAVCSNYVLKDSLTHPDLHHIFLCYKTAVLLCVRNVTWVYFPGTSKPFKDGLCTLCKVQNCESNVHSIQEYCLEWDRSGKSGFQSLDVLAVDTWILPSLKHCIFQYLNFKRGVTWKCNGRLIIFLQEKCLRDKDNKWDQFSDAS